MVPEKFILQAPLFHRCNLNCAFCMERTENTRDTEVSYEYIKNLPQKLIDVNRDEIMKRNYLQVITVGVCGGEIFMDSLPDEIYIWYYYYFKVLDELLCDVFPHIEEVNWNWNTNLVFENRDRVDKFLSIVIGAINTSYDSVERFSTEEQKKIWYDNLMYYRDRIGSVTFVFTKQNVPTLMKDPMIKAIPEEITLDASYYYPSNPDYPKRIPSDALLYEFLKWGVDTKLFNCSQIADCFNTFVQPDGVSLYCSCFEGNSWVDRDDLQLNCFDQFAASKYYKPEDYKKLIQMDRFDKKTNISDDVRGCFYCEYNGKCQKMCYMMVNSKLYKLDELCPFYRIYKYIELNDKLIDEYKDYKKRVDKYNLERMDKYNGHTKPDEVSDSI